MSALLVGLGEVQIKNSDFRYDTQDKQAETIGIGIGYYLNNFAIKRIMGHYSKHPAPKWYNEILLSLKKINKRNVNSKAYLYDFRVAFEKKLGHTTNNHTFYFKIEYSLDTLLKTKYRLTESSFRNDLKHGLDSDTIKLLMKLIQPGYAFLKDERNFEGENIGSDDSTTNKLFNLFLPVLNSNVQDDKPNASTPIGKISIIQLNEYLLERLKKETNSVVNDLNANFSKYNSENIKVDWEFSNKLFESMSIKTNFHINSTDNIIDFQAVGSGTRSIYKMVLLQTLLEKQSNENEPVLFLLEEPELYLYPKLEREMASFIKNISEKNQVFVTTHSHMVILEFSTNSLFKVYRDSKSNTSLPFTKITKLETSTDIMEILGYDITYLIGKDFLIFVEGKDDLDAYQSLVTKVFGDEYESKFLVMTSVSKLAAAVNFNFLDQIKSRVKTIFIIDSDGTESIDRKNKVINEFCTYDKNISKENLKKKIILTEFCMLECYTFEKKYLVKKISDDEFEEKKKAFLTKNFEEINKVLRTRKCRELDSPINLDLIKEQFEHVRKYGFTKKLVNKFRGEIGDSGFKKLKDLSKEELMSSCPELIKNLSEVFELSSQESY